MCGIFGIVANQDSKINYKILNKTINTLFKLSETRGRESAGISIKSKFNSTINVYKNSISASKMINDESYKNFIYTNLYSLFSKKGLNSPLAIIAHTRLVTNGSQNNNSNNQPVIKNGNVIVHNGIIVNTDDLWRSHQDFIRKYEVDTEIFVEILNSNLIKYSYEMALHETFNEIYGSASFAHMNVYSDDLLIASNTGSLYFIEDRKNNYIIFSSEKYIINKLYKINNQKISENTIQNIKKGIGCKINIESLDINILNNNDKKLKSEISKDNINYKIIDYSLYTDSFSNISYIKNMNEDKILEFNQNSISNLKRCKKCILPETFPFLSFDVDGVCSYCKNYLKQNHLGIPKLIDYVNTLRKKNGKTDCLVAFSGGRDSSYSLHYIKKELKLNPIAYTYDWGMVTDLARRNQARICGKLGIEHILISADIKQKRKYIKQNVEAWLERPRLGTIPLFMAGDKQFFYYAYYLKKINKLRETILCENQLERTSFKSGFAGVKPYFDSKFNFALSSTQKIQLLYYYGKEFFLNPSYLNSSLFDSGKAFTTYYLTPHSYFNLFDYLPWDEKIIENTLINEYDWELSPDTKSTWRIGDGTAPFYNYIYYNVAGFSEFDTFRSNQIREGLIERDKALLKVNEENQPRYESIKWYLNTIGLEFEDTINRINKMPKLYLN